MPLFSPSEARLDPPELYQGTLLKMPDLTTSASTKAMITAQASSESSFFFAGFTGTSVAIATLLHEKSFPNPETGSDYHQPN
jgi:hypothetical protein